MPDDLWDSADENEPMRGQTAPIQHSPCGRWHAGKHPPALPQQNVGNRLPVVLLWLKCCPSRLALLSHRYGVLTSALPAVR